MVNKINDAKEMSFLKIREMYPNEYILVRIVSMNYKTGTHIGVALYTSRRREDLFPYARQEGSIEKTTTLQGENLMPMVGGLLWAQ